MKILVTGAAGFIGMHTCKAFLDLGHEVVGLDNYNPHTDIALKYNRINTLLNYRDFSVAPISIVNKRSLSALFECEKFDIVIHLAAQAGVRYSIENPQVYTENNIVGFSNILECSQHYGIKHLVFASSSSVYGDSDNVPFTEEDATDNPVSYYAATKKCNEMQAKAFSVIHNMNITGLRFFTVYGPYGRPDMAPFLFTKAIYDGEPIDVFNNGKMKRDFTFVDDIVESIKRISEKPEGYNIYNIGNNDSIELGEFIETLEDIIGKKAKKNMLPMQAGDVKQTYADSSKLYNKIDFKPETNLRDGLSKFVEWYKDYYKIK